MVRRLMWCGANSFTMKWKIMARTETDNDINVVINIVSVRFSYKTYALRGLFCSSLFSVVTIVFLFWSLLLSFSSRFQFITNVYMLCMLTIFRLLIYSVCLRFHMRISVDRLFKDLVSLTVTSNYFCRTQRSSQCGKTKLHHTSNGYASLNEKI